jgi:uncharacterized protein
MNLLVHGFVAKRNTFCLSPPCPVIQRCAVASCTLDLKTIPNAPRNQIAGWLGGALKVKVQAPAREGRANEALLEFLAEKLRLPRRAVTLKRGDKSRQKVISVDGLSLVEARERLEETDARAR